MLPDSKLGRSSARIGAETGRRKQIQKPYSEVDLIFSLSQNDFPLDWADQWQTGFPEENIDSRGVSTNTTCFVCTDWLQMLQ